MNNSNSANRPSQSHMRTVRNSKGVLVPNLAYEDKGKNGRKTIDPAATTAGIMASSSEAERDAKIDELYDDILDNLNDISPSGNLRIYQDGMEISPEDYSLGLAESIYDSEGIDPDDMLSLQYGTGDEYIDEANEETILKCYTNDGISIDSDRKTVDIPVAKWMELMEGDTLEKSNMTELFESVEGVHSEYPLMNDMEYERVIDDKVDEAYESLSVEFIADELADHDVDDYLYENDVDYDDERVEEYRSERADYYMDMINDREDDIKYEAKERFQNGESLEIEISVNDVIDNIM